ncbi:unnamed protein product [Paramecium octaurelia]|uniref:Uncharacterized protein n=1 Tax=Paramecium octaurelia TaxID=43137 RepID=A0A8S1YPV5_PAROT|nr:unnamed protein product [Paramecium octaurelia]
MTIFHRQLTIYMNLEVQLIIWKLQRIINLKISLKHHYSQKYLFQNCPHYEQHSKIYILKNNQKISYSRSKQKYSIDIHNRLMFHLQCKYKQILKLKVLRKCYKYWINKTFFLKMSYFNLLSGDVRGIQMDDEIFSRKNESTIVIDALKANNLTIYLIIETYLGELNIKYAKYLKDKIKSYGGQRQL